MYARSDRRSTWRRPLDVLRAAARSTLAHGGARMFSSFSGSRLSGGSSYHRAQLNSRGINPTARTGLFGRGSRFFRKKKDIMPPRGRRMTLTPASSRRTSRSTSSMLAALGSGMRKRGRTQRRHSTGTIRSSRSSNVSRTSSSKIHRSGGTGGEITSSSMNSGTKKIANKLYQKSGSIRVGESGGTQIDSQCVYVGVGTPVLDLYNSYIRALVAAIVAKAGGDITNWNNFFNPYNVCQIDISYINDGATTQTVFTLTTAITYSMYTVANLLRAAFVAEFLEGNQVQFIEAVLWEFTEAPVTPPAPQPKVRTAVVPLQRLMLDFEVSLNLSFQNQTASDLGAFTSDAVDANPLKGMIYECNGNYFEPTALSNRPDPTTTAQFAGDWCVADSASGILTGQPYDALTKKPPQKSYFARINKATPMKLAPGQLHSVKASRTQTMSWTSAMTKLLKTFYTDAQPYQKNSLLGCSLLVALEKMMDTRLPDETPISIGYQTEVTTKCRYHYKKTVASAVINDIEE